MGTYRQTRVPEDFDMGALRRQIVAAMERIPVIPGYVAGEVRISTHGPVAALHMANDPAHVERTGHASGTRFATSVPEVDALLQTQRRVFAWSVHQGPVD